jgi:hypothetical protein
MRVALFVEGKSDRDTLSILARRVFPSLGLETRVLARGDLLNATKVAAFINQDIGTRSVSRVLVCVDSECTPEGEMLKIVTPVEKEIKRKVKHLSVAYCGVIHATEAWLAADGLALGRYLGCGAINPSVVRSVVSACKPKDALSDLFDRHGREFSNVQDNPRLASLVDPKQIAKISKSFARFAGLLVSPRK